MESLSVVLAENARLATERRPLPPRPAPDWALVRVVAAGVCGSDIPRAFSGGAYHYPLVMGHEFAGVVTEPAETAPEQGPGFPAGSRVAVYPLIPNPRERINEIGQYALGREYDYFGSRRDGAFQEYVWVPAFNLFPVRDELPLVHAALVEPCAVAYHAVDRPSISAGATALVIGGGPIGLMVAQWLRVRGCARVLVSEMDPRKRTIAADLGFEALDSTADPVGVCIRETGGADVVIEAVGQPVTFRQAIQAAGIFGQVVFLGNIHGDFSIPEREFSSILRRELTVYGTWNSSITPRGHDEWTRVLAAIGRTVHVAPLISHTPPLADAPAVLRSMHDRAQWYNKVVFSVSPDPGAQ